MATKKDDSSRHDLETPPGTNLDYGFRNLAEDFGTYVTTVAAQVASLVPEPDEKPVARVLADSATTIARETQTQLLGLYSEASPELCAQLDRNTRLLGASTLMPETLRLMEISQNQRGGVWGKILSIIEAVKKIVRDILSLDIFGLSLKDLLPFDIDKVFRVLDNILQELGKLFGGSRLAEEMYEQEIRNIRMTQELTRLAKLQTAS